MRAIVYTRYGRPHVLQQKEIEKPRPNHNEVLVRIRATTVSAADYRARSFTVPALFWLPARIHLGLFKPKRPVLGVEFAGEVDEVGTSVTKYKKGDLVFAASLQRAGGYAEYCCVRADSAVAIKPSGISDEVAAAIPIGARTALHYVRKSNLTPGKRILIYGASGSVGTYAVQLAKRAGAFVTAACSDSSSDLLVSLGADEIIDYRKIHLYKPGENFDAILVAVDQIPFSICNKLLRNNGIYLNTTAPVKSLHMFWTAMTSQKKFIMGHNCPESAEDLSFLANLVQEGYLKVVIDRIYPIEQIVLAHEYVDSGRKKGNVVIKGFAQ